MELTFCSSDSSPGHYNSVWPVVWRDMKFRSMAMCWFFNRKSLQSCAGKLSLKFSVCPAGISECCWWSHWCAVLCVCKKHLFMVTNQLVNLILMWGVPGHVSDCPSRSGWCLQSCHWVVALGKSPPLCSGEKPQLPFWVLLRKIYYES